MSYAVRVRTSDGWQDLALVGPQGPQGPQGDPGPVGSGAGDVTGPASSVADRIAVYNGATGKLIKDGGKTLANLTADFVDAGGDTMTGHLALPTGPAAANAVRKDYVDAADATLQTNINAKASTTYVDTQDALKVAKLGDIMTGHLGLPSGPAATQAVRKDYVDAADTTLQTSINAKADTTYVDAADASRVRYDAAQALTGTQQTQARTNIYAAPFDALACNGMQINGSMDVSQENGTTALTLVTGGAARYPADGWFGSYTDASVVLTAQNVPPPGSPAFGGALQSCAQLKSTTGATIGNAAGDYAGLFGIIEGYRFARLAFGGSTPSSVTIAFWAYATVAGTMTVALRNSTPNRSYVAEVVINSAATWEYKTVTIPGDASGTWLLTTGIGARVSFMFGVGSTFQAAAGAWSTGSFFGTAGGSTNFFASNNNVACITGVILIPGTQAPTAAQSPLIMRPYDQELVACQRYWKFNPPLVGHFSETTNTKAYFHVAHDIPMRTTPAVAIVNGTNAAGRPGVGSYNATAVSVLSNNNHGALLDVTTATALINVPATLTANSISFDARL